MGVECRCCSYLPSRWQTRLYPLFSHLKWLNRFLPYEFESVGGMSPRQLAKQIAERMTATRQRSLRIRWMLGWVRHVNWCRINDWTAKEGRHRRGFKMAANQGSTSDSVRRGNLAQELLQTRASARFTPVLLSFFRLISLFLSLTLRLCAVRPIHNIDPCPHQHSNVAGLFSSKHLHLLIQRRLQSLHDDLCRHSISTYHNISHPSWRPDLVYNERIFFITCF